MVVREVCKGVYSIGVFDWDRQVFDELLPLPDGTTYNSFLIEGSEKTVLIDTVDPEFEEELITNIARSGVSKIDYIIINHAEQDHSGSIPVFQELFPNAKIITSEKGKELLKSMLQVPDFKISTINDRDTLSLGDKTLEFIQIPWSHWPDSMMTYIREDKMLISMDLFGSHYATSELFIEDVHTHYVNARRYFAEIMMPFRYPTAQNVQAVRELAPEIIAPSHGPIYKGKVAIDEIISAYTDWCSDRVSNKVIIPYISMHGSTKKMVSYVTDALLAHGITVKPYNLGKADTGRLAADLIDAATIIIATPTVLFGPHPKAANLTFIANILKPKAKFISIIGSFGWGGTAVETLKAMFPNNTAEIIEPVYIKGLPDEEAYGMLDRLVDEIVKKHNELFKK